MLSTMTDKPRKRRRRRSLSFLTPALIVDTAVGIVETEGADALTFRRIGAALDVDHTVILRQYPSKDLLLLAMTDRVLTDVVTSFVPSDDWRETIRDLAQQVRVACRAHPGVAVAVAGRRTYMEAGFTGADIMIGCLLGIGLSGREAASYFRAIIDMTFAYAALEATLLTLPAPDPSAAYVWSRDIRQAPADKFPHLASVAADLPEIAAEDQYAVALDLILDAIELRAARETAPPAGE